MVRRMRAVERKISEVLRRISLCFKCANSDRTENSETFWEI